MDKESIALSSIFCIKGEKKVEVSFSQNKLKDLQVLQDHRKKETKTIYTPIP